MDYEKIAKEHGLSNDVAQEFASIMEKSISFKDSDGFKVDNAQAKLFSRTGELPVITNWKKYSEMAVSDTLVKKVLTKEQEFIVFSQYNFARFQIVKFKGEFESNGDKNSILGVIGWYRRAMKIRSYITTCNLRLVTILVSKFMAYKLDMDDLYSEGYAALLDVIDGFDAGVGTKFSTYAYWAIVHAFGRLNKDRSKRLALFNAELEGNDEDILIDSDTPKSSQEQIDSIAIILEENLAELDDFERKVLEIRYLHREKRPSVKAVSEMLNANPHSITNAEKKALKKIKTVFEKKAV